MVRSEDRLVCAMYAQVIRDVPTETQDTSELHEHTHDATTGLFRWTSYVQRAELSPESHIEFQNGGAVRTTP